MDVLLLVCWGGDVFVQALYRSLASAVDVAAPEAYGVESMMLYVDNSSGDLTPTTSWK